MTDCQIGQMHNGTGDNIQVEGDKNAIKTPEKKSLWEYVKIGWGFVKGLFGHKGAA